MPLVTLEKPKQLSSKQSPWKACLPFVENSRGVLMHRPRSGSTYHLHKKPHIAVSFWCGMTVTASDGHLTFTAEPSDGAILCERCEAIATKNGLPTADELAGRHVHKGKVVPVVTCCSTAPEAK